jgi:hypothetical protein
MLSFILANWALILIGLCGYIVSVYVTWAVIVHTYDGSTRKPFLQTLFPKSRRLRVITAWTMLIAAPVTFASVIVCGIVVVIYSIIRDFVVWANDQMGV